jgi:hypothetical protein
VPEPAAPLLQVGLWLAFVARTGLVV